MFYWWWFTRRRRRRRPQRPVMSVRLLWAIVALVWIAVWWKLGLERWCLVLGIWICIFFSWRGFLAGRHGIYR